MQGLIVAGRMDLVHDNGNVPRPCPARQDAAPRICGLACDGLVVCVCVCVCVYGLALVILFGYYVELVVAGDLAQFQSASSLLAW